MFTRVRKYEKVIVVTVETVETVMTVVTVSGSNESSDSSHKKTSYQTSFMTETNTFNNKKKIIFPFKKKIIFTKRTICDNQKVVTKNIGPKTVYYDCVKIKKKI